MNFGIHKVLSVSGLYMNANECKKNIKCKKKNDFQAVSEVSLNYWKTMAVSIDLYSALNAIMWVYNSYAQE